MAPLTNLERPIKLLLVENERNARPDLRRALEVAPSGMVEVELASELSEALRRLSRGGIDLVLLDLSLPDSQGIATFERASAFEPEVPIVVVTDARDDELGVRTLQSGAQDCLVRQELQPEVVLRSVRYAIERHRRRGVVEAPPLYDELTGLYNPRGFTELGTQYLKLARRSERGMTLLYVDLDRLQTINESLGHHVGDRALQRTADILRGAFRRSDVVARVAGDEFAVLAIEASGGDSGLLVTRLRDSVRQFNGAQREPYQLSLSIGTSRADGRQGHVPLHELLERARSALAEEKASKLKGVIE